jgi:hypothetical protein
MSRDHFVRQIVCMNSVIIDFFFIRSHVERERM